MPLCLIMALGYGVRRLNWLDDNAVRILNRLTFRLFLPVSIFKNLISASLGDNLNWGVFIFTVVGVLALFGILFLLVPRFEKDNAKRGVLIQGIGRSNFVIFGLSVVQLLYGEAQAGVTALLVALVIPLFNIPSVIALEMYGDGQTQSRKKILKGIVTNPLIIATLVSVVYMLLGIQMPRFLATTVNDIAKIATPLGLFVLGSSFSFSKIGNNKKQLFWGVAGKLVLNPLVFITLAIVCGFRNVELASLMVVFAAPVAVSSFTMAQQMGGDEDLAAQIVLFTSLFSVITMFLWIFITKQLGFL